MAANKHQIKVKKYQLVLSKEVLFDISVDNYLVDVYADCSLLAEEHMCLPNLQAVS